MVMLESVVARACKTGEPIPGKVCCSILVTLLIAAVLPEKTLKVLLSVTSQKNYMMHVNVCIEISNAFVYFNLN